MLLKTKDWSRFRGRTRAEADPGGRIGQTVAGGRSPAGGKPAVKARGSVSAPRPLSSSNRPGHHLGSGHSPATVGWREWVIFHRSEKVRLTIGAESFLTTAGPMEGGRTRTMSVKSSSKVYT